MPPMPGMAGAPPSFSFGASTTTASAVVSRLLTEEASSRAVLTTCSGVGSFNPQGSYQVPVTDQVHTLQQF